MGRAHQNPNDPNIQLLEIVAAKLGSAMLNKLIFVGGSVAGLLITDPILPAIRPTEDVDLVVQVTGRPDFYALEDQLRALGFVNDISPGAPMCRWRCAGIMVDVVPSDKTVLGFANHWYPLAIQTAEPFTLPSGIEISIISAPCFCATKLEAFADRGNYADGTPDYLGSHDLGDFLAVLDGRAALHEEIQVCAPDLQIYLAQQTAAMLANPKFLRSIEGHLQPDMVSQLRVPAIINLMQVIASMGNHPHMR